MAKNNVIRVEIDGDSGGLQRALQQGTEAVEEFGGKAGGVVEEFTGRFSGMAGGFSTAMTGLAGAAAIGIGGLAALVQSSREYVREMNEISKSTGLSVVQLQQLSSAFSGLGLEMDKFGDFNKDTLDKLGDAFRAGGGVSDDLKEFGLNLQDYNKYLKQTDGGMKAVIHTFYAMRDAGKSQGEIVNVMETLASDSSHMISTLQQFNNEADATAYIQQQNADVTNEAAEKYAEFDKNLTKLTTNIKGTIADGLSPLVDAMNGVYDAANQKPHEAGLFEDLNQRIKESKGSLQDMLDIWEKLRMAGALNYQGAALHTGSMDNGKGNQYADAKKNLEGLVSNFQNDIATVTAPKGGWVDQGKEREDAQKKADQLRKQAEQAQKQADAKRLQAQRNLETALAQVGEDGFKVRLQQFDRQQKALLKTIADSAKVLGINPDEMLKNANTSGAKQRTDLINSMVGYSDPNQGLKDTNSLIGSGLLNDQQKGYLSQQQNQRINGGNPFAYDDTDQRLNDNQDAMNAELAQNDLLLKGHEDYEKRKAQITAKYNAQAIDISNQNAQQQLTIFSDTAQNLSGAMVAAFGESSGAAEAAFMVSRGITIAQTVLSIQSALAQALATPWPQNLANYAQVASLGLSIISTAKGADAGQFHGGVDDLPAGYDNKSFVLKAGERVVQPEANKKLTKFLDTQDKGGSTAGDITVNAPLIIQGDVAGDDKKFNEMLQKHANSVTQAVRSSQRRNT
ncbi:hypothetical protein [Scandinavium lactucae]|uniref:Uncharacterized protein n=1 Tax=Scandinavium lactucae TaxID=3095028 RepID=A0ABU4QU41_9ENTR|nr:MULTISPECIES: hypothetical protein [unclassified Scandinavium]MDX6042796.1 hypothetical protein [Scandinavium sp. V105_6]MDX6052797.1 hypothetical protein [Scandinavium sp. V105_1]